MSTYSYLQNGDTLPMVSILQLLLNRQIEGKKIGVDGVFGPKTGQAVADFQYIRHIPNTGIVDRRTWSRLVEGTGFKILDCIDITEDLVGIEKENELQIFQRNNISPVVVGAMCNGVAEAINQIIPRVGSPAKLILLRFHGHGGSGIQGIADGKGEFKDTKGKKVPVSINELSSIDYDNLNRIKPELMKLRSIFGVYSCVELHGCEVAKDRIGKHFVSRLAKIWGVPVSAGNITQLSGLFASFKFEGDVFTAFPKGKNFKTWSAGLPRLAGVCLS